VPIDLFIYIVIAIVLVVWLRNTIGSKHGSEIDRSDIIEQIKERQQQNQKSTDSGRIIDLSIPQANTAEIARKTAMDDISIEGGEDTAKEVIEYMNFDSNFHPKDFVNGAKEAFPMIVEAFSRGDLKTLKMLLSDGVYTTFEQSIEDRKSKGETLVTDVHVVKDCKIMGIKRIDRMAYIKLRFLAEETIVIRDRDGNITHGNPDKLIAMNDVWTFGRDVKSKDPTWYLFETSDDVPEELKNPLPDSK
jgi:predicted lipid-binding transport protein (Tim44 family)